MNFPDLKNDVDAHRALLPRIGCDTPSGSLTLETTGLSRIVGGKVLLSNISVATQSGQILAVVGPSGAGKSTFLRLLNRLDEPTEGTVLING